MESPKNRLRRRIVVLQSALDELQMEPTFGSIPESLRMPLNQYVALLNLNLIDVWKFLNMAGRLSHQISLEEYDELLALAQARSSEEYEKLLTLAQLKSGLKRTTRQRSLKQKE
jgi:hypothetical protein